MRFRADDNARTMNSLELIARAVACTASLILAVALLRASHSTLPTRLFGAALCVGVASYLACSSSTSICSGTWLSPALILASGVPFFFWGWTASIMDDEFVLPGFALLGAGLLMGVALFGAATRNADWHAVVVVLHSLLGLAFVAAALAAVLRGWRQDLIEARRRLRVIIVALSGGYSIVVLVVELFLRGQTPSQGLLLLNAALLAVLLFGLACAVLDVSAPARMAFGWTERMAPPPAQPAEVHVRDREQELVAKLQEIMTTNAAYRDANVAIATLATRLGVPEKKLREVINGRLGFKNFPSYVNAFRVEEVRLRLIDSKQDQVPILTMALEAGFGSIVAFNRAFKEKYGQTPSAYRNCRGESPDQHTVASSGDA
jgi:AraC-like DNA-binding protein